MNENHVYDMIIVGGGPGGYTSALYAARAGFDTIVLEKLSAGGQMSLTWQIDNYPGFENGIDGFSLAEKMQKQAEKFGAKSEYAEVFNMDLTGKLKRVETSSGIYIGKTVVIATGANPRELGLAKEKELIGHGVAYCASCDGMFYKDKIVVVVGGGNSAVSDAALLSRIAKKVIIVHRRDTLRATKIYHDQLMKTENIEFRWNNTVNELIYGERLTGVRLKDTVTGEENIIECDGVFVSMDKLDVKHPVSRKCLSMVVAGNTTMIHFLLGIDAFCVFYTPHAVHADRPGFQPAKDLDIPLNGYVYCYPAKSNYLGGDIISGMIETELYKKDGISVFFDIGTNGELVIGNKDFLLCGAGAAGPALEGGVVHTGMRADAGAVDSVRIRGGKIHVHVIGNSSGKISPKGICGSGIVDLIAELFLEGWIDIRGKFSPEKTNLIQKREGQLCIEYAPGLYFYQKDIDEFILTKAAAHIMVEIMLRESGLELNQADRFYVAGSFGKYVSVESAITIGMYPDMEREKMINAGNSSLEGAQKLLLNKELLADIDQILEEMTYIQFAEVDDFLEQMVAAQALPHTDYKKYPTVMEKLKKRQNICFY